MKIDVDSNSKMNYLGFMATMNLKRVCKGLYMDTKNGVTLDHEVTWQASMGRKWIASWKIRGLMGLGELETHSQKFDTATEGREFLRRIVAGF